MLNLSWDVPMLARVAARNLADRDRGLWSISFALGKSGLRCKMVKYCGASSTSGKWRDGRATLPLPLWP